jgi:uncharacterized protein (TIGR01777 family)
LSHLRGSQTSESSEQPAASPEDSSSYRPLKIVVAGAGGLIGRHLVPCLAERGHDVRRLVRRDATSADEIAWDPDGGTLNPHDLQGAQAIVHLGGESIAGGRWTAARKAAIRASRVTSTALLARTLAQLAPLPETFVCASAIGFYGNRGDEVLTESSGSGDDFLSDVCREWEAATAPAASAGVRVVNARLGLVLSPEGGALEKMLPLFRAGLAGPIGDGRQFMSWISLPDSVRAFEFALRCGALRGPVNFTAPEPVSNREFARTLGSVLNRPTVVAAPAFAVRMALGEMGSALLLGGQRVLPARLLEAGFVFEHPNLSAALRSLLNAI